MTSTQILAHGANGRVDGNLASNNDARTVEYVPAPECARAIKDVFDGKASNLPEIEYPGDWSGIAAEVIRAVAEDKNPALAVDDFLDGNPCAAEYQRDIDQAGREAQAEVSLNHKPVDSPAEQDERIELEGGYAILDPNGTPTLVYEPLKISFQVQEFEKDRYGDLRARVCVREDGAIIHVSNITLNTPRGRIDLANLLERKNKTLEGQGGEKTSWLDLVETFGTSMTHFEQEGKLSRSRSLREGKVGKVGEAVAVWELPEPDPLKFTVEDLVPEGFVSSLFGDGGTGKSYLAIYLLFCLLTGKPFAGRKVVQQESVLYMDFELSEEEFRRRCFAVARGMKLDGIPQGIHYFKPPAGLLSPATKRAIQREIARVKATVVIVDSLTVAMPGSDVTSADCATAAMDELRQWDVTVVALDHMVKPQNGEKFANGRAYGSVFKWNLGRSQMQLTSSDRGGLLLRHKKANFGSLSNDIAIKTTFTTAADKKVTVEYQQVATNDPCMEGVESLLKPADKVVSALSGFEEPVSASELAQALGMEVKTVQNHLTKLNKEKVVHSPVYAKWAVIRSADDGGAV